MATLMMLTDNGYCTRSGTDSEANGRPARSRGMPPRQVSLPVVMGRLDVPAKTSMFRHPCTCREWRKTGWFSVHACSIPHRIVIWCMAVFLSCCLITGNVVLHMAVVHAVLGSWQVMGFLFEVLIAGAKDATEWNSDWWEIKHPVRNFKAAAASDGGYNLWTGSLKAVKKNCVEVKQCRIIVDSLGVKTNLTICCALMLFSSSSQSMRD